MTGWQACSLVICSRPGDGHCDPGYVECCTRRKGHGGDCSSFPDAAQEEADREAQRADVSDMWASFRRTAARSRRRTYALDLLEQQLLAHPDEPIVIEIPTSAQIDAALLRQPA